MRHPQFYICFALALAMLFSCNPDCDNYARVDAVVTPISETELLLSTIPNNFLEDRELFVEKLVGNGLRVDESTKITAPYSSASGGRMINVADIPDRENTRFYVRDIDCGGYIPLNSVFQCETLQNVTTEVSPKFGVPGQEVLLKTTPPDFLTGKKIFISRSNNEPLALNNIREEATAGGVIVTLPSETEIGSGDLEFLIQDELCGGFSSLRTGQNLTVATSDFIAQNRSLFILPAPPTIVVPNVQVTPPVAVIKGWFSPQDRDYCLWFVPEVDSSQVIGVDIEGDTLYKELPTLRPGNPDLFLVDPVGPAPGTREISVRVLAGCTPVSTDESRETGAFSNLLHFNPISGIVDKESGYVNLAIDRSSKGLGVEHFEGALIQPESIPEDYRIGGGPCDNSADESKISLMVLTSRETGRQLILYRGVNGLGY